ncbi:hypothetical protein QQ045_016554 [Rhodiola kirilowii]
MAAAKPSLTPRFRPVDLPARQYSTVEGKPSVHFTTAEFEAGVALFRHLLIAKFTMGRPSIEEIRRVFKEHWTMRGRATVTDIWDSRHLMIILDSEEDAKVALTSPLRKVGHASFRLFRYTPDYSPRRESTTTTKWVRLPGLHPGFVTRNYVAGIVNSFGDFLVLDERSKACSTLKYVRACVEIDVTKYIPEEVRITLSDGRVFWQKIEVEGNLSFYSHCKIHGHTLTECRKKKPAKNGDRAIPAGEKNRARNDNRHNGNTNLDKIILADSNQQSEMGEFQPDKSLIDPKTAVVVYNAQQAPLISEGEKQKWGDSTIPNHGAGEITILKRTDSNKTGGSTVYCNELDILVAPSAVEHFKKVRRGVKNDPVTKALDRVVAENAANKASSSKSMASSPKGSKYYLRSQD